MTEFKLPEPKVFDPKDPNPCSGCSHCCEYIAFEIDTPQNVKDFRRLTQDLLHQNVWVYVDDENMWHLQFNTPCDKLLNQRCDYYTYRPNVCRDYAPEECSRYGDGKEALYLFRSPEHLYQYLAVKRPVLFDQLDRLTSIPFSKKVLQTTSKAYVF